MAEKFVTSPEEVEIADTPFELSDGLEIDGGVLESIGVAGGFVDNFDESTVNATYWPVNNGGILDGNGNLTFDNIGATGWAQRYIISRLVGINFGRGVMNTRAVVRLLIDSLPTQYLYGKCGMSYGHYYPVTSIQFRINADSTILMAISGGSGAENITENIVVGQEVCFIFDIIVVPDGGNHVKISYSMDDMVTEVDTGVRGVDAGHLFLESYYVDNPCKFAKVEYFGYARNQIAELPKEEAYTVQPPATLASLDGVLVNRASIGNGGEARLYFQYKDDEYSDWKSFDGVIGEWSDVGLIDGNFQPITNCKPLSNGFIRPKIVFTGSGLVSYPSIDKITYYWSSDVTAPDKPVITTAIATSESILTLLFANLPADAYAYIFEIDINGAGSLPMNINGNIGSGEYLRFVGSQTTVEKEGERNTLVTSIKGLADGDQITITAFARDRAGNISAGTQAFVTMSGAQYVITPVDIFNVEWETNIWEEVWT